MKIHDNLPYEVDAATCIFSKIFGESQNLYQIGPAFVSGSGNGIARLTTSGSFSLSCDSLDFLVVDFRNCIFLEVVGVVSGLPKLTV